MIAPASDPVGIEIIETLAETGFDYIELSLRDLAAASDSAFAAIAARVDQAGILCEACNNFFAPDMRLTGTDADPDAALRYTDRAFERAARLGVKIAVLGSPGARNVPPGFPPATAWRQLVELLQRMGPVAERHGVMIAIEPLNRQESNLINSVAEGLRLSREVNHPHVQLLVDFFHFEAEKEDLGILQQAGPVIRHTHCAGVEGRGFPSGPDASLAAFFQNLRQIGYAGRCSIEAFTRNFASDARRARSVLDEMIRG